MNYLLLAILFAVTWKTNAAAEPTTTTEGSGGTIGCTDQRPTANLNCSDNERVDLYQFDISENRCIKYSTCPSLSSVMYSSRPDCEQSCPATECSLPRDINNGIAYITRSHDGVVTAHYACFNSYNVIGSLERSCQYNGSWSGTEPYCIRTGVVCEEPIDVVGANKEYSCTSPGCLVVYSCNEDEGYQRVEGIGYRKCGEDGQWMNTLPTCTRLRVMQDESEVNDEIKATKGQKNFEVRCVIEPGVPQSSVARWTRVGSSDSGIHGNSHWLSDNKSLALNFGIVNENDAGKYKCIVDGDNVLERSVEFVVVSPMTTVTLLSKYSLVSPVVVILTCIFEAKTKPSVKWYKDGDRLISDSMHHISDKTLAHPQINFNVLEIYGAAHLGDYYCEANDDNSTQEWFLLQQSIKRSIPMEEERANVLSTFDNICMDKTTGVYIGKIKRKVKGYTIRVRKELVNSKFTYTTKRMLHINNKGVVIPEHLSLKDQYIVVVNADTSSIIAYYPYSKEVEGVITNACRATS